MKRKTFRTFILLLFMSGCSAPKAPPARKTLHLNFKRSVEDPQPALPVLPPPFLGIIPWQYLPGSNSFCWQLQASSNLIDWIDLPPRCQTDPVTVTASNQFQFFRLKGTPP